MLADVALTVKNHTQTYIYVKKKKKKETLQGWICLKHQQLQPRLLAESFSQTTAECMPVLSRSQFSNLRTQTPLCTNCRISSFSLWAETLCRSYRSLLSFPKSPPLQDSLYRVLEFVCARGCSCAFSSLVPVKKWCHLKVWSAYEAEGKHQKTITLLENDSSTFLD